ncbi:aromatic acid exporter family protein [Neobacillus cucumis]|uniref:aromatic acid exporter family protein n=1 Tax=Neobacillus cucumis TaxID=1740721 RepID=UPI00203A675A|nr:aromatic acid exporter family protein [Neobacillus cucumis]MCM3724506.1 aromatic acid exporter family protein [Neobacillus cucumis]
MKFRIGYRTIKTAVGTAFSILIAQQLGLNNFASAGILTILCIQVTKRRSLRTAWDRFLACALAMPFSALFFEGIGYHPIVIGVMLLFFIPIIVMLKAPDGVVTSSVIILHIFMAHHISWALFFNELGVITVGISVALLINLYMPSADKKLREYQMKIEGNFKIIFCEMVRYLKEGESSWDGKEITESAKLLDEAKMLALRDFENHILREENLYFEYFKIREKQFEIIERVLPIVTSLTSTLVQGKIVAAFLEELSENIHPGNTAYIYIDKLRGMKKEFEEMELPKTREEFEVRASLLQLVKEMNDYLIIKSSLYVKEVIVHDSNKVKAY